MPPVKSTAQPAAERAAAEAELKRLIDKFAPDHEKLVGTIRRALRKRLPSAYELVYEYRDCFVVSVTPSGRGFEGVFGIRGSAKGVQLYFTAGNTLPDPDKLLSGSANARYVDVETAAVLTRPGVVRLMDEAVSRNRVPIASTGRGPVVVQSLLGKKAKRPKK